jgi:hypothetical protein
MYDGNPMTVIELMILSQLRQDAIDGLKHTDAGVAIDAKEEIIKTYGVKQKMQATKDSPMTYRLLRKDAGLPAKGDIARFLERIKLINECQPHPTHPYRDFFNAMKGIETIVKGSDIEDSDWLKKKCELIWAEITANHNKKVYVFPSKMVTDMGTWLFKNHKSESATYLAYDEDTRKEMFTALKNEHRRLIAQKVRDMFMPTKADGTRFWSEEETTQFMVANPSQAHKALQYLRQLCVFLGCKGFGKGEKPVRNAEGDTIGTSSYGKSGGAIWNMPEEQTLWLAELVNQKALAMGECPSMNPYMEEIKAALLLNREKAVAKAELKAQKLLADMD